LTIKVALAASSFIVMARQCDDHASDNASDPQHSPMSACGINAQIKVFHGRRPRGWMRQRILAVMSKDQDGDHHLFAQSHQVPVTDRIAKLPGRLSRQRKIGAKP
jgi:hypothetical protein